MMLYQSGRGIDPGKMYVRLNPGNNGEFAVIELTDDGAALFIKDAADADALIAAACEAKKLLEPPVITDSDRTCDQANPGSGAWCHRGGDHGVHEDTDGEKWRTPIVVPGRHPDQSAFRAGYAPDESRGYLRCEDTSPAGGFTCTLSSGHAGLHAQLIPTGAFEAEWGYADGHVHTTSGHQPASVTGGEDRCECSHQKPEHGYYAIGTAPPAAHECRHPGCGCGLFRLAAPKPHAEPPAVVNGDVVLEVRALLP